jgi:large subunit ribosomal protein L30
MPKSTPSKTKSTKKPGVLQITLIKSPIGYSETHKATVRALGLRRMHQTVEQVDSPSLRGMIAKIRHLVNVVGSTEA